MPAVGVRRRQGSREFVDSGQTKQSSAAAIAGGATLQRDSITYLRTSAEKDAQPPETASPNGSKAPVMKLSSAPVPSRFARPIVLLPALAQ